MEILCTDKHYTKSATKLSDMNGEVKLFKEY